MNDVDNDNYYLPGEPDESFEDRLTREEMLRDERRDDELREELEHDET